MLSSLGLAEGDLRHHIGHGDLCAGGSDRCSNLRAATSGGFTCAGKRTAAR